MRFNYLKIKPREGVCKNKPYYYINCNFSVDCNLDADYNLNVDCNPDVNRYKV